MSDVQEVHTVDLQPVSQVEDSKMPYATIGLVSGAFVVEMAGVIRGSEAFIWTAIGMSALALVTLSAESRPRT